MSQKTSACSHWWTPTVHLAGVFLLGRSVPLSLDNELVVGVQWHGGSGYGSSHIGIDSRTQYVWADNCYSVFHPYPNNGWPYFHCWPLNPTCVLNIQTCCGWSKRMLVVGVSLHARKYSLQNSYRTWCCDIRFFRTLGETSICEYIVAWSIDGFAG